MTDDSSLVELSKLLHTHHWPGDISLLIGSFLMICDPHDRDNEIDDPEELLSQLDHARWAPLRKEPWLGKVIHNDEIYELGVGAPGRETYHMDIAPDDGTIVDDYSYARGASVCRMRYPGDSDEEEEFFGDDDDD